MITKDSYEGELKKFRKYCRKHPNELGCYVYALADPTKGKEQVFYVGKGQKNGCSIISLVLSNIRNSQRSNLLEKNLSEYNEYIILDIK